jgi:phage terminase small subunit
MELNDLLLGVEAGLSKGLDAYTAARERQQRDRASQAGLLQKGMEVNPQGQVQYNPQMQQQVAYDRDSFVPASDRSQRARTFYQGLLEKVNPQYKGLITPDMPAHEIENSPLLQNVIKGEFQAKGREVTGQRIADRTDVMRQGLLQRQDTQASHAADLVHKDKRVMQLSQQLDQLERGRAILDQPTITNQEFNDYQQEIQAAIAGASGGALGKLERTEYTTAKGELAALKQKITGKPEDAVPPEIVERLKNLADHTRDLMARHRSDRAESLRRNKAFSHNPAAQESMAEAIQSYKAPEVEHGLGKASATSPMEDAEAIDWAKKNPQDPRAQQILQMHGAK